MFSSSRGILGIAPYNTIPGNYLAILSQYYTPLVLRRVPDRDYYKIVERCYIDGFMLGEVAKEVEEGRLKIKELKIG
jgi:hypothetical protein